MNCLSQNCRWLENLWTIRILTTLCKKFWWGSSGDSSKIQWMEWGKLGLSKSWEVLDLEMFTVLTQHYFQNSVGVSFSLLIHQLVVFFNRSNFPKDDFMQAKLGYRPSYVWRSLLSGRDLLWHIGNGEKTKIWKDQWIERPFSNRIQSAVHML